MKPRPAPYLPVLHVEPKRPPKVRRLVIWLPGFSGSKEGTLPQLEALADAGFVAVSFDPYQHGARRIEANAELVRRVRSNIRRYFWPILARTAEEVPHVIDWATKHLDVSKRVGIGGISMGGDISVAAAGVYKRIVAVAGCLATPDWLRPGSFEPPGKPDAAAQADYDRRNPLTHLKAYRHHPAITFQVGDVDHQVPPDGAERFVAALRKRVYAKQASRLQVVRHPETPHRFVPAMLTNSIRWFQRFIPREK